LEQQYLPHNFEIQETSYVEANSCPKTALVA